MAVHLLTIYVWVGRSANRAEIENPAWLVVERAIRDLNNRDRNDVYLTPDRNDLETYLAIGGGDGRYLVTGCVRNDRFPTLIHTQKVPVPEERLVVGGQEGVYPGNWIVDLEMALQAARVFYEAGTFGVGANWRDV
jgi:hypothetical protein